MGADEALYCDCLSRRVRGCISSFFVIYARFVCKRPWTSLLVPLIFVLACAPGFNFLTFDGREGLHYVWGSYSFKAYTKTNEAFSSPRNDAVFMYFTAKDGKNLFSSDALKEIGLAMDKVLAFRTPSGQGIEDICERSWRGTCEFDSVFHSLKDQGSSMGVNTTRPHNAPQGKVEFLATTLDSYCNANHDLCRRFLLPQAGFLAVVENLDGTGPVLVESLVVIIYLNPEATDRDGLSSSKEFQKTVLQEVHGPTYHMDKDKLQTSNFYTISFSQAAIELEGQRPATAEGHLMAVAFIIIVVFVCFSIVSPVAPRSRILLSMSCMLVVGLSLACSIALCAYVTVPLTSIATLVIFTLFGVSVDDIIVMVHSYDRTDPTKSVEERITQSLQDSGTAITLTSTTSFVAFMSAAACPILNIRYFCIVAAFGILSVFILQITLFMPLFIIDENRRSAMRRECCFSLCWGPVSTPKEYGTEAKPVSAYDKMLRCITAPSVGGGCGVVEMYARNVSRHRFAQVAIFITFVLVTGLGIVGSVNADTDADLSDYYIDSSFLKKYFQMSRKLWKSPTPVFLNIEHQGEGMFSDSRRAEVDSLFSDLGAQEWVFDPQSNWLRDFDTWLNITSKSPAEVRATKLHLQGDPAAFGVKVATFLDVIRLSVPGTQIPLEPWRHKKDVVLENGRVKRSRLRMSYDADFRVQATYVKNWKQTYDMVFPNGHNDVDISEGGRVKHVWVFAWIACAAERDARIKEIIFASLGIACAAVAVVVMIMLNPLVGFFVGVLVLSLDAIILALLQAYGAKLDFVAFLCLSLTIGLVVDYATHTSHAYLHYEGTPDEKLYHSIREMGSSVLSGGGSTLLGIGVLGFASSKAFRSFFYVLGTAIFMGTVVGIVVSPVLLRCLHGAGLFLANLAKPKSTKSNVIQVAVQS